MDFLKSAVASAISKGPAFPYSFGDRVDIDQSIWSLYNGTKREDGSKCSIFSFDVTANRACLPLARNALRKLRTLRHPGVIKVLDTVETDSYIYIATERLTPLNWHIKRKSLAEETLKWGLHNVAKTVKFINTEATSVHGCIRPSSIFLSESGEWKLGGFDTLSSVKDDDAVLAACGSLIPDAGRYMPPEISKGGWDVFRQNPVHAIDAYNFGTLIFEVFNGSFLGSDQLTQVKSIPPSMHQSYKRLLNPNPKARLGVSQFLDQGRRAGGFFQTPLIQVTDDIESLGLKAEAEREEVLGKLDEVADDFPADFFKMKVLPELLKSVEFGGGGPKIFGTVMQIGAKLSDDEYDAQITPVVLRLFANPDRAIRVCLLDNLPLMIDHLSQKIVNDKIFPQMVTGFTDVAPVVREQTVKSVLTVVPKLSDRTLNGELLRYLAKTANDEQPGIRTNTTICLGKIARNLGANTRSKVLLAAFTRALRDPFVHARSAALMALAATSDLFSEEDCATKLLPGICPSLIDKEKVVREQAQKCLDIYLHTIRKYSQTLPDTVLPTTPVPGEPGNNTPRMGTVQTDTSSWAGWAISSFTNKLTAASGEIQAGSNGQSTAQQRPASVPLSKPDKTVLVRGSGMPLSKHSPAIDQGFSSASLDNTPDFNDSQNFGDEWGGFEEEPQASSTTAAATTASKPFDDQGEPDFAGWLEAQSKAKKTTKNPLPKGLTKSTQPAGRPALGVRPNTTGHAATKKGILVPKKEKPPTEVKKVEPDPEEEDAWGDAW
ncbi:ARM repeat-containing protein [Delitschia confertaspora ATCC 74209]|uniref:ARM repeat-containing protein n=1 Tax=Delitschia confertaspora ATCC 74209 TaxID=1513339 RepID=A0A9P4JH99_9PLEO|nr:ARM repeat-containing protein [Delitschia confertaspora ATCC 74209]